MGGQSVSDELRAAWRAGFRAGWESSGEGYNGEYPDEGVPWLESAGYDRMLSLDGDERLPTD